MTVKELKERLDGLGIEYPEDALKADLEALLPAEEANLNEVVVETAPVKGDREIRWKAFLLNAQALNPVKFEKKKKRGQFDSIPDSFR
jgi:hypothetical protein